ncbi:unnamed protein product [marine sediment metagenome]|uniref:Exonuclease domain-containing protein n=1 Tax=marine sediment metagenome TaxID=412755 RepID=X0VHF3_9ZZZZ
MAKILWFDTETTGIAPACDIVQVAGLIEIDGDVKETFNFYTQPFDYGVIEPDSWAIHGISLERMQGFPLPAAVHFDLINLFSKYIDKYDSTDKFYPAGYNVRFDLDFLASFFKANGDAYFGSWQNWRALDPLYLLYTLDSIGAIHLPNYRLETVAAHYGIDLTAHDALSDVKAARQIYPHVCRDFVSAFKSHSFPPLLPLSLNFSCGAAH